MKKVIDGNQVLYEMLKKQNIDLLQFIIESSYFSRKEDVEKDKKEMIFQIENGEDLFIRHKSKIKEIEKIKDGKSIKSKSLALKYQKDNVLYYNIEKTKIPIKFDSDGNYMPKIKLKKNTKYSISSGKDTSDFINYKISHIWDNTSHPLYFSSLWNIIVVPKCLDHFVDDDNIDIDYETFSEKKLNTKMFFKALVTVLYDLKKFKNDHHIYFNDDKIPDIYLEFASKYLNQIKYFD